MRLRLTAAAASGAAALLVLLVALPGASAQCPNLCNGHGRCVAVNKCECYAQWAGGDCSQRKCPTGTAWADIPSAEDTAHAEMECSNRGVCNYATGVCECMPGYEGLACNRMICPGDCSGNGECHSMKHHAMTVDKGTLSIKTLTNPTYSNVRPRFAYGANWDAELIHGCTCDGGWEGWECSARRCPKGDDPMTTGQVDEKQLIKCTLPTPSTFRISYNGALTEPFASTASAAALKKVLEATPTVGEVDVVYASGTSFCLASGANTISITFLTQHGSLPRLIVVDAKGKDLTDAEDNAVFTAAKGESLGIASVEGDKENLVCSGRGRCNEKTGTCSCFTGFTASDTKGARGNAPDCGYAYLPITSCPGTALECSGHGTCSGSPAYQCTCYTGWQGGDCAERACPQGPAWFDYPTAKDTAHASAECSNKGRCNRVSGQCECQAMFEGEACERMTCPGSAGVDGVCSGHGQCLSMSALAEYARDNGDPNPTSYGMNPGNPAAWDGFSVFGCMCDDGFTGYDCSQRTCPLGHDMTLYEGDNTVLDERQELSCELLANPSSATSTFRLSFRGAMTVPIRWDAPASTIEKALNDLDTIDSIKVEYQVGYTANPAVPNDGPDVRRTISPGPTTACWVDGTRATNPAPPRHWIVFSFQTEHGDVPPIRVVMDEATRDRDTGTYDDGDGWLHTDIEWTGGDSATKYATHRTFTPGAATWPVTTPVLLFKPPRTVVSPYPADGVRARELYKGTSIDVECSARGICDRATGTCQCFLGFGASNDNRGPGEVENCGWREPYVYPKSLRGF